MKFEERKGAERRFTILQLMVESGGSASESEIFTGLCALGYEFMLTEDVVRADLVWLKQRNLVTTTMIAGTMMMAQIGRMGIAVVEGRLPVEGLLRPIPQE